MDRTTNWMHRAGMQEWSSQDSTVPATLQEFMSDTVRHGRVTTIACDAACSPLLVPKSPIQLSLQWFFRAPNRMQFLARVSPNETNSTRLATRHSPKVGGQADMGPAFAALWGQSAWDQCLCFIHPTKMNYCSPCRHAN
jgi:hypothetical protein